MTVEHLQGNYKGQNHTIHYQFSWVLCNSSEISKQKTTVMFYQVLPSFP